MKYPRFSAADYTFPMLTFEKSLDLIRLLDFDGVDLGLNPADGNRHLVVHRELERPEENGKKVKEQADRRNLPITDVFMQLGPPEHFALNHPDRHVREEAGEAFRRLLEYAAACETKHVSLVPGYLFNNDFESSIALASKELAWRVDLAQEKGLVLGIEAHTGSVVDTPQKTMELLQRTPGLTLTLDYSHFLREHCSQESVDPLVPYASHMHLRHARNGVLQTIYAENEIDYKALVDILRKHHYKGILTIEFCSSAWENINRVDTIGESILLKELLTSLLTLPKEE